jgi:plasmid stabilization system protein ParE
MAYKVRIQPSALQELDETISHLKGFGDNTASSFLTKWQNLLEGLRDGAVEHRLSRFDVLARLGYRTVLLDKYIILYFTEGEELTIAHLFHQSQDYASIVIEGK